MLYRSRVQLTPRMTSVTLGKISFCIEQFVRSASFKITNMQNFYKLKEKSVSILIKIITMFSFHRLISQNTNKSVRIKMKNEILNFPNMYSKCIFFLIVFSTVLLK